MGGDKQSINLAVVGHTQHGKSTILGRYLCEIGRISQNKFEKYRKIAREIVRDETHVYSLIMHRTKEELEQIHPRKSIVTSHARVEISNKLITLIDTPGHFLFHKNRMYGIFQSDCVIVVIEANEGIKEGTIEALRILKSLETSIVAVTISKMDEVDYSRETFETRVEEVKLLLDSMEVKADRISFFPTAALHGEGIRHYSQIMWFDGPTFEDVLNSIAIDIKRKDELLRLTVYPYEVFKLTGKGLAFRGTVESGVLNTGDEIIFEPLSRMQKQRVKTKVRSLELTRAQETLGISIEEAVPRYVIGVLIREHRKLDLYSLLSSHGNIAGHLESPPQTATKFEAEITLIEHPRVVLKGYTPELDVHVDHLPGEILEIKRKRTMYGDWDSSDMKFIRPGEQAIVEFETRRPVAIEENDKMPWLSRFVIRDERRIEGFGKCTKIIE